MRPYQVCEDGPWVDLDTVQWIKPPVIDHTQGPAYVALSWRHAFQDKAETLYFRVEKTRVDSGGRLEPTYCPATLEDGRIKTLAEITDTVFEPFLAAWSDKA